MLSGPVQLLFYQDFMSLSSIYLGIQKDAGVKRLAYCDQTSQGLQVTSSVNMWEEWLLNRCGTRGLGAQAPSSEYYSCSTGSFFQISD